MLRQTTARALKASTSAILDFLEKNPRVSCKTIAKELNMPLKKVNAVHYQYGFTGSAQAKKLFPIFVRLVKSSGGNGLLLARRERLSGKLKPLRHCSLNQPHQALMRSVNRWLKPVLQWGR